jgi:hypothetical protein
VKNPFVYEFDPRFPPGKTEKTIMCQHAILAQFPPIFFVLFHKNCSKLLLPNLALAQFKKKHDFHEFSKVTGAGRYNSYRSNRSTWVLLRWEPNNDHILREAFSFGATLVNPSRLKKLYFDEDDD